MLSYILFYEDNPMTILAEFEEYENEVTAQQQALRDALYHGGRALGQMLDCIGMPNADDHSVAKILIDNELELRNLLNFIQEQEQEVI